MRNTGVLFAVLVAMGAGAPGTFANEGAVAFDDSCGDSHGYAFADGQRYDLPPTDRTPRYDLRHVSIESTAHGVRAQLQMCGAIGDPDGLRGYRAVYAQLPGECVVGFGTQESVVPTQPRTATFFESCYKQDTSPLAGTPLGDNVDERFNITLPAGAVTVDAATMTIDLDRTGLTGAAAQVLAPNTVWTDPGAVTVEGQTLWGFGFSTGGEGDDHTWGYSAPTAFDGAFTHTTFTVQ
jgi:hypothetical protein